MIFNILFSTKQRPEEDFGLSETRKSARNNHGKLTLNGQLGQGSTFVSNSPVVVERADL